MDEQQRPDVVVVSYCVCVSLCLWYVTAAAAVKGPSKKRRGPTKAKTTPDKGPKTSLEDARKAAREEVERRIQERAKSLIASKKK